MTGQDKYGAADLVTATFVQRPNWPGKKKKRGSTCLDTILAQKSKIIMIVTIFPTSILLLPTRVNQSRNQLRTHAKLKLKNISMPTPARTTSPKQTQRATRARASRLQHGRAV